MHIKTKRKTGMVIIGADMNTRLVSPGSQDEEGIGPYIFGHGEELSEGTGVEENRNFLKQTLIDTKTILMNTFFKKQPDQLITYKLDKTIGTAAPWTKGRYELHNHNTKMEHTASKTSTATCGLASSQTNLLPISTL